MDLDKVGKFIAKNRNHQKLTQKELAELLGVNPKTVSKWERGINAPDIAVLTDLAKYLNVTIEELLAGEKKKKDKSKFHKIINNIKDKSNKKAFIAIITFIIVMILIIAIKTLYTYKLNNEKSNVYHISTDNEDYVVNGYLIMNKDSYSVNITDIKSIEMDPYKRNINYFSSLTIEYVSNDKTLYSYTISDVDSEVLVDTLQKINIQFNYPETEDYTSIIQDKNNLVLKYCINEDECNNIQLDLSIEKVE